MMEYNLEEEEEEDDDELHYAVVGRPGKNCLAKTTPGS